MHQGTHYSGCIVPNTQLSMRLGQIAAAAAAGASAALAAAALHHLCVQGGQQASATALLYYAMKEARALHASTYVASSCLHPSGTTCRLSTTVPAANVLSFFLVNQQSHLFSRPLPVVLPLPMRPMPLHPANSTATTCLLLAIKGPYIMSLSGSKKLKD